MKGCSRSPERAGEVGQTKESIHKAALSFPDVTFIFKKDIDFTCPLNHGKDFESDFTQTVMHYRVTVITLVLL